MSPTRYGRRVDDVAIGRLLRTIRITRGMRQVDVAASAGVSDSQVSRVETGRVADLRLVDLRAIAGALEVRIGLAATWRGGEADRIVNASHVALQQRVMGLLPREWTAEAEVTFSIYGERGSIDILAWHRESRTVLVIEVKTELSDPGRLVAQVDRYRRLASAIAQERGWGIPATIGVWVVIAESSMNRRRLASAGSLVRTGLPDGFRALRSWLRTPTGPLRALSFLPYSPVRGVARPATAIRRVSRTRRAGRTCRISPASRGAQGG